MYDVIIIGGGFLGCMTAQKLSEYQLNILVLEKEYDLGEGASKANSGVLYPGIHARPNSLKARSNVNGNLQMDSICKELDVPIKRTGSMYLLFGAEGQEAFDKRLERGIKNGVPDVRLMERDEILEKEPLINPIVEKAIYAPTTGIISPFELLIACGEQAALNNVEFRFEEEVRHIEAMGNAYQIVTSKGDYKGAFVVNTAGGFASVMEAFITEQDLVVEPRKGEYLLTKKEATPSISHVLYQAQETTEGGTLIAPTMEGNLLVGPTSTDADDFYSSETTEEGAKHLFWVAQKILPSFSSDSVITSFAGLRANITNLEKEEKDFFVRRTKERFISAIGIKNPGMTASPYLSDLIIELLQQDGLHLEEKKTIVRRTRYIPFLKQTKKEQEEHYAKSPQYGELVCRCEQLTVGDIIEMQKRPFPPYSLDSLKKRLRLGMGQCQGGFCTGKIITFLHEDNQIPFKDICKSTAGSLLVEGRLK